MVFRVSWRSPIMPPTDILVFGEDDNDRRAVAHIIRALLPANSKVKITLHQKPVILDRDACKKKRSKMNEEIAKFVRGYQKAGKSVTVIMHRDCDAVEPAHIELAKSLENERSRQLGLKFLLPQPLLGKLRAGGCFSPKRSRRFVPLGRRLTTVRNVLASLSMRKKS